MSKPSFDFLEKGLLGQGRLIVGAPSLASVRIQGPKAAWAERSASFHRQAADFQRNMFELLVVLSAVNVAYEPIFDDAR